MSVASFYDMFHLEPVGEHMVECDEVAAASLTRKAVLEAFERDSASGRARRRRTGPSPFAPSSAWAAAHATIVAVDHRFRQSVHPRDVPGIVAELRSMRRLDGAFQ